MRVILKNRKLVILIFPDVEEIYFRRFDEGLKDSALVAIQYKDNDGLRLLQYPDARFLLMVPFCIKEMNIGNKPLLVGRR